MIQIKNVEFSYSRISDYLRLGFSLSPAHSWYIGKNGEGKSTLLKMIQA
jgi:ABC-type cobalamin/Fe3+-siderophores transport system ATPase subunit